MAKPSIGILHYSILPVIGGVEHVIADHARLLTSAGYPVTVFAGRGGNSRKLGPAREIILSELDSEHLENRAMVDALAMGETPDQFESLCKRIQKLLVPGISECDLLFMHNVLNFHFNLPLTAALCGLLERDGMPKQVAWCHDISRYVNPESGAEQRFGYPWDLLRTFQHGVHYVAVSSRRRDALAKIFGISKDRIQVIPNGVSPEWLFGLGDVTQGIVKEFDLLQSDLILLMPIRITPAKNIEFALRVVSALKRLDIQPRLVITGPPDPHASKSIDYFEELLGLRRRLGLEREALFIYEGMPGAGPTTVGSATIAEFYRLADIVLMPSLREGFGLPILEAGLLQKAIFATEIPAVDEVGAELVHTIAPDEPPDQVAERMRAWAENNRELGLRRRVRQEYTWQALFEREIEPLIKIESKR